MTAQTLPPVRRGHDPPADRVEDTQEGGGGAGDTLGRVDQSV